MVFGSRLGTGVDLQFLVNPAGEGADGAEADVQLVGDFLQETAFRKQGKDFGFTGREAF